MDETQIIAYLNGELSPEEALELEAWIAASDANAQIFADVQKLWQATEAPAPAKPDVEKAWRNVRFRVRPQTKTRRLQPVIMRVAAAILVLISVYFVWRYAAPGEFVQQIAITEQERQMISLPDGTQVWLNQYSQLTYPVKFSVGERRVKLNGEAYFEVEHNPEKPFLIESGETEVRVLGTSFGLMAYPDSNRSWVQVRSGRVAFYPVGQKEKGVQLSLGESGVFERASGRLTKFDDSDPNLLAWQNDTLIFQETPCLEVFKILEKTFQIKIALDYPPIPNCTYTGVYENQDAKTVMQGLAFVFNLDLEINADNKIYTLKAKDE